MKKTKKMQKALFGGAMALQAAPLLKTTTTQQKVNTAAGFVGIGVAGATSGQATRIIESAYKKKKKRR